MLFWTVLSGSQNDSVNALALAPDGSILVVGTKIAADKLLALLSRIAHVLEVMAKKVSPNFRPQRKPEPAAKPNHPDR